MVEIKILEIPAKFFENFKLGEILRYLVNLIEISQRFLDLLPGGESREQIKWLEDKYLSSWINIISPFLM